MKKLLAIGLSIASLCCAPENKEPVKEPATQSHHVSSLLEGPIPDSLRQAFRIYDCNVRYTHDIAARLEQVNHQCASFFEYGLLCEGILVKGVTITPKRYGLGSYSDNPYPGYIITGDRENLDRLDTLISNN